MQNVVHLVVVTDQFQQGLACGAGLTYAKQVLCGGIQPVDQQVFIDNDDAGIELLGNSRGRRVTIAEFTFAGFACGRF